MSRQLAGAIRSGLASVRAGADTVAAVLFPTAIAVTVGVGATFGASAALAGAGVDASPLAVGALAVIPGSIAAAAAGLLCARLYDRRTGVAVAVLACLTSLVLGQAVALFFFAGFCCGP